MCRSKKGSRQPERSVGEKGDGEREELGGTQKPETPSSNFPCQADAHGLLGNAVESRGVGRLQSSGGQSSMLEKGGVCDSGVPNGATFPVPRKRNAGQRALNWYSGQHPAPSLK